MAAFQLAFPDVTDDGWGPSTAPVPEKFKDIPYYAPFNKGDKLGKAADWQQFQGKRKELFASAYLSQLDFRRKVRRASTRFLTGAFLPFSLILSRYYQDDDSTFQVVDSTSTKQQKQRFGRRFQQGRGYQNFARQ